MSSSNAPGSAFARPESTNEFTRNEGRPTKEHTANAASREFERDVLAGLTSTPKSLPCKYFYDARGSALFEEICRTEEYYVTRTELDLLRMVCPEVSARVGAHLDVLEPGSGAGEKIRVLLDSLDRPRSFTPVDISPAALRASVKALEAKYPALQVHPLVADFTRAFPVPEHFRPDAKNPEGRRMIFFPGSTISNFTPEDAVPFLSRLRALLVPGDFLFIGVDRIKDSAILERAYDDAAGVTARFNLNLLERMRRELDTDLDPSMFQHRAVFNEGLGRIEMHLDSREDQIIHVCGRRISFRQGESIHTENSYKYTPEGFERLATAAGFRVDAAYSDEAGLFSLYLCSVFR